MHRPRRSSLATVSADHRLPPLACFRPACGAPLDMTVGPATRVSLSPSTLVSPSPIITCPDLNLLRPKDLKARHHLHQPRSLEMCKSRTTVTSKSGLREGGIIAFEVRHLYFLTLISTPLIPNIDSLDIRRTYYTRGLYHPLLEHWSQIRALISAQVCNTSSRACGT